MKRQEKGITLVALVVTIIVLLILAGVAINMVLGENGYKISQEGGSNILVNLRNNLYLGQYRYNDSWHHNYYNFGLSSPGHDYQGYSHSTIVVNAFDSYFTEDTSDALNLAQGENSYRPTLLIKDNIDLELVNE